MSLDGLRDAYSREKKNEIAFCEGSRKRKLRELYHYSALLNAGHPPQVHDWLVSDEPSENEARFLDENDITKGRRFNDATLPFPHITELPALPPTLPYQTSAKPAFSAFAKPAPSPAVGLTLEEQLRAASASPSVATQPLLSVETLAQEDAASVTKRDPGLSHVNSSSEVTPSVEEQAANQTPGEAQQPSPAQPAEAPVSPLEDPREENTIVEEPSVDPKDAIPPTAEDAAILPADALRSKSEGEPKAPQVVHLPPQEVQEARLQETERKLERAAERERKEDEKLALPNANASTDLASSPSSTVGAYSQATPRALHHSPDTSPDTESFRDRLPAPPSDGVALDPAAQQVKDDHERALRQQMQEARERARAESPAADDVERQIEDEQAIRLARDGKSRLEEPQAVSTAGPEALVEHAEEIVSDMHSEAAEAVEQKRASEPAADSLPTPTTTAPEPSTVDSESVDSAPAKASQPAPLEHPTPPADDVEMDDAPLPDKEQPVAPPQPQPTRPQRMTTRVSSGAIRQKSVSEIIGEKPEKPTRKTVLTPRSSNVSASASPVRPRDRKRKEVTTVIFAKSETNRPSKALQLYNADYASLQGAAQDPSRDYLHGLFQYQAHHPPRSVPLNELVASARKTLSTAGTLAVLREQQDYKILKRVYHLQNANRWSLRQIKKCAEPERPVSHLDHMLAEMKWMQTDFKEERKWKKALAATFAGWCMEFVNSSAQERSSLRVRARIPPTTRPGSLADEDMNDVPTPDLVDSGANETESEFFADDEELLSPLRSNAPAGLFSLGFNDIIMKIDQTPVSETMLRELPMYEPVLEGANDFTPVSFVESYILPVSKLVTGKLVSQVRGPPRKRSRYDYDSEDEPSTPPSRSGTSAEHSMPSTPGRRLFHRNDLPPEMTDVALFNPENRHIRDRLQVAHQFRPPTEFPMPSVAFFENRNSSQWLWEEDQKLRALVKEYTFNWSLVAQQLALPSLFVSGSGRRTPWECFERWVQLEGLPAEMSKTQYFRTYQGRLEQAQRTVLAQHQAQQQLMQQQAQNGQSVSGQPRRRTTQPIRVERRRENRHLAIIDGMRKLARKRESMAHKQAESQKAAALRKAHEQAPLKNNVQTPQEVSRLKWEREEKYKQKMLMQQEMTARQIAAQRQAQIQAQAAGMANGVNQQRNATPGNNQGVPTPMANSNAQQGHHGAAANAAMAARAQQQALQANFPNGNMAGIGVGSAGVPQAQMQANLSNSQRMPPPDQARMMMQRGQYPNANQHQFQLQQQQINMASNLTQSMAMNGIPNGNIMASMAGQNLNGNMNAPMNGMANNAGSPRMNQANSNMQSPARPLSSGHMPQLFQIQNNLKVQHPEWTQEQVQKAASDHLTRFMAKQRVQAMNAATGSSGIANSPQIGNNVYLQNGGMANSPSPNAVQNYQQQLVRQQQLMSQQRSQQAASPAMSARPPSRSATPQNPQLQQSPAMQQAQVNRN